MLLKLAMAAFAASETVTSAPKRDLLTPAIDTSDEISIERCRELVGDDAVERMR